MLVAFGERDFNGLMLFAHSFAIIKVATTKVAKISSYIIDWKRKERGHSGACVIKFCCMGNVTISSQLIALKSFLDIIFVTQVLTNLTSNIILWITYLCHIFATVYILLLSQQQSSCFLFNVTCSV